MNKIIVALIALFFSSCADYVVELSEQADDFFFLRHDGADMPVQVQGNTASGDLLIMLHGGPGGSAIIINGLIPDFTDPLEEQWGVVYWEQRASGTSQGSFSQDEINIDQYVEDLDRLIDLLEFQYGEDTRIHLCGISWGGFLGTKYLEDSERQSRISTWINLVGPSDFLEMSNLALDKMEAFAEGQILEGLETEFWQEVLDFTNETDTIVDMDGFLDQNSLANRAERNFGDSVIVQAESSISEQLSFLFSSPFSSNAFVGNVNSIASSSLIEEILSNPTSTSGIETPSLFVAGRYDFVVPSEHVSSQFESCPASRKQLRILGQSSHVLLTQQLGILIPLIVEFVNY